MGTHIRSISIVVNRQSLARLICIMLLCVYWMPFAYSLPSCLNNFNSTYPNSASGEVRCQLCHVRTTGGPPWNGYGWDLRQNGGEGSGCNPTLFATALAAVESLDSDGEGRRNIDEINASTQPGWTTMGNRGFSPPMEVVSDADSFIPSVDLDPVFQPIGDALATFAFPNIAGSSNGEAVVFGERDGTAATALADLGSGAVLNTFDFTADLIPIDADYGTDLNGDGDGEIYGLLWDEAASVPKVEARDPLTGTKRKNINYSTDHEPIALGITGNQSEEGVVLVRHTINDDRGKLLIRNLISRKTRVNIPLPKTFRVEDLVMAPDFSGNGFGEAIVSAARFSDEKGFILIYDTGVAKNGLIKKIPISAGQAIISYDYTLGPGSVSAVTVQALRASDSQPRLYMFDAMTGVRLWVKRQRTTWVPLSVKAFETASGGRRVAALMQRQTDQRPLVAIYNANTGKLLYTVLFKTGLTGVDLTIFPDTTLDSGGQPELGVTMDDGTIRVRDSQTKDLLQTLNAP
jgi:hypothetical protein